MDAAEPPQALTLLDPCFCDASPDYGQWLGLGVGWNAHALAVSISFGRTKGHSKARANLLGAGILHD